MNFMRKLMIFTPGIRLMQQARLFPKMMILVVFMFIPICTLTYFLHAEMTKVTDFAEQERKGVQYILPLSEVLIELSGNLSEGVSSQNIAEQIKAIDKNEAILGKELKTTASWNELKPLFQKMLSGGGLATRQAAITKTTELIAVVGDSSNLVLDPDMDSYYIMDTAVVKYPDILSKTSQIASMTVDSLSKPQRTVDDQIGKAMVEGAIRSTLDGAKVGLKNASAANAALKEGLDPFSKSENATIGFLKLLDDSLIGSGESAPTGRNQAINSRLKQTNEINATAFRLYLKQLDDLLAKRISDTTSHEKNVFTVVIVALLIAGYLLLSFYLSFKETVATILAGTRNFAAGDWRASVSVVSADELADTAVAMNTVRERIRPIITEISNAADQVAASSEELTASSEQAAKASSEIASSINAVAAGAAHQVSTMDTSAVEMERISSGIQNVSTNTVLVSEASEKTAAAAQNGSVDIHKAMAQMNHIESAVLESAKVVGKLGERSKEIGQIVDTISGIASQTNLLALNAAIEAARAGEQGRGFAVVADEVRKLAEQSQESAKQIATLIGEIRNETEQAVQAMETGTKEVAAGTEIVNAAGTAFNEIVQQVSRVSGQIRDIAGSVEQIDNGTRAMVAAVVDISSISKSTAGQTQNIAAATEEQSASMQEIASSNQQLAKLAEELREAVNNFRV